jgi:hypothetical protein
MGAGRAEVFRASLSGKTLNMDAGSLEAARRRDETARRFVDAAIRLDAECASLALLSDIGRSPLPALWHVCT